MVFIIAEIIDKIELIYRNCLVQKLKDNIKDNQIFMIDLFFFKH